MTVSPMVSKISAMFSSPRGKELFSRILSYSSEKGITSLIDGGVLLGLSGGADSVFLACFLKEYSLKKGELSVFAVHINHLIRGDEADRDEAFASKFCSSVGFDFASFRIDVPKLASDSKQGVEEAARNARYKKFDEILLGRKDLSCIAVAHNAEDNMETALINILRGAGSRGAAGIKPVRDSIVRPILCVSKKEIVSLLSEFDIPFVTDSTNFEDEYRRNYIRNRISPLLSEISESPERMFLRLSDNLRSDDGYITSVAQAVVNGRNTLLAKELKALHPAVFVRVVSILSGFAVTSLVSDKIRSLVLSEGDFSYDIGEGLSFISERGVCRVARRRIKSEPFRFELNEGINQIEGFDSDIIICDSVLKTSLNVYKISIQADLSSAIIYGRLFIRPKMDGDSVYYGGMTHKLKKLFNDRKIPPSMREDIPVLCDERGVVWVPGFGVRDDGAKASHSKGPFVVLGIGKGEVLSEKRFRTGNEFRS